MVTVMEIRKGKQTLIKIPWGTEARQVLLKDEATAEEIDKRAKFYRKQEQNWLRAARDVAEKQEGEEKYAFGMERAEAFGRQAKSLEDLILPKTKPKAKVEKRSISSLMEQAYYDWASNDAYLGGGGNYRLKSNKSRIAPWNKEVKARYGKDNNAFHDDAQEWKKTHSTIKFSRLKYEQEHERSSYSQKQDLARRHSVVIEPSDPRVKQWMKDQGTADISGIDTPSITKRTSRLSGGRVRITPKRPRLKR